MINPNRFIQGLSDVGMIMDTQQEPTINIIKGPSQQPVIIPTPFDSLQADEQKPQ